MSSEITNKFILDASAGFRMMWFNKKHPNAIFLDEREKCNPDVVGDYREMSQFPSEKFRLVVIDPPQFFDKWNRKKYKFAEDFGLLNPETWQSDLQKCFAECWRVLRPFGVLVLKWSDHDIKAKRLLKLFPVKPLFGQISKGDHKSSSRTYWFCFMKIPEGKK